MQIADFIVKSGLRSSKNEARRLIEGKGFKLNDIVILDPFAEIFFDSKATTWIVKEKTRILEFDSDNNVWETLIKSNT